MDTKRRLSLVVGTFALAAIGAFAFAVLTLTSESGLFTQQYRILARFDNVQGLLSGAPIWLAGKEVGVVGSVEFTEFGSNQPILVSLRVNTSVQNRVRTDSLATIGTIGVLGDSYIEINPGSVDGSVLIDGETIPTLSPTNLFHAMAQGAEALDSVSELARNLNQVITDVREVGVIKRAASAVDAASKMIIEVEEGNGMLHSVIYEEYAGGGIESIERSLASLEEILTEVRSGHGLINALIYQEGGSRSAQSLEALLDSLSDLLTEIRTGEGLLHSLIYDAKSGELTAEGISMLARLNEILAKVEGSDGTLGLMINDPSLYEDLQLLLGGAQRSAVLRTLINMATKD